MNSNYFLGVILFFEITTKDRIVSVSTNALLIGGAFVWGRVRLRLLACLPACCARVFPPQQFLLRAQRRSAQRSRAGRTTGHTAKAPAVDSKLWLGFSVYNVLLNCLCARYTCVCCRFPTGFNKYLCWVRLLGLYLCNCGLWKELSKEAPLFNEGFFYIPFSRVLCLVFLF